MHFTKLRLQGFKSFVDPTELVIAEGLTGVVGPNGCGKSNLLEALRWVMGETRPTAVRGDGMEDVIFDGAETRPARNAASVELVLDNTGRRAPPGFNDSDQIEISRRVTRDIGSAYTINGRNARARDVQMLFADASTGAHSPALVRQGQIGELINAKPKARRRILEEAAGISGLYQRRHEAELKLNGTEANLARVEDVLESLDGQLKSLERQAGQARRYREIGESLRRAEAVLLYLRWRAAEAGRAEAEADRAEGARAAARAEAEAGEARRAREAAEAALAPTREEAALAAALLQRLEIERDQLAQAEQRARDRIAALEARARQLAEDLEHERSLGRDAETSIGRLDTEEEALATAHRGHDAALAEAEAKAQKAATRLSAEETALDRLSEEAARIAARAKAVERALAEAQESSARIAQEIERAEAEAADLARQGAAATAAAEAARAAERTARGDAERAEAALSAAEAEKTGAWQEDAAARTALSEAEAATAAIGAEVAALEHLLAREDAQAHPLIDRVTVAPGYEAALGAALGEDLSAPADPAPEASGWVVPGARTDPALPAGAEALSAHVAAPALLARRLAQVGVVAAEIGDRVQADLAAGQRIVSREGDLWRWDGYRLRAADGPAATTLRLAQRNRLAELTAARAEADAAREQAAARAETAAEALAGASARESAAREARRAADLALAEAARTLSRAEGEQERLRAGRATQADALTMRRRTLEEADAARAEAETAQSGLEDAGAARDAVEAARGRVDLARTAMLAARGEAEEIRREGAERQKRRAAIAEDRARWRDRATAAERRIREVEERIAETETELAEARAAPDELAGRRGALAAEIEAAECRDRAARDALAEAETALRHAESGEREAERAASAARETRARLEAVLEGAAAKAAEAADTITEALDAAPADLAERLSLDPDALPALETTEIEVARLRRQRDALGAVNLRAEDDAAEIAAERDRLAAEKADLDQAIAKLRRGIGELNREGRERLTTAFDAVNEKFSQLFRHLFGGGEARLVMVDSEDPLDAGLEILCQPPGKKLATLSLLSGGEQTLTALSLIFAVFLSNPAPICVLDEVDAPLDDSNVLRFCALLDEMVRLTETRFLIITHNAITMSRMDRLFGVTMVERGVSQLVSVDLSRAAEMVEA